MFAPEALVGEMSHLKKFALRLTHSKADADDLLQSTLVRAMEKQDYFQDDTSLSRWTSKIMFNLFVTNYRRRTKFETQYDPQTFIANQVVDSNQEQATDLDSIGLMLEKLSPEHREIITLTCMQDLSYEEAANRLNIPVGTVRSRLGRAREHLHGLMQARRNPPQNMTEAIKIH